MSESFSNDAAIGAATFDVSGTTGNASIAPVTVQYNAATQAYSFVSASGSITFRPSDIDASQSNAGAIVYVKQNGSVADTLTLTRPGTSGRITFTYVGSAFWQHTQIGNNSGSGFIDAASYGVTTPDPSLPRAGNANYAVDVIGAVTDSGTVTAFTGQGTSSVDFASGSVIIVGRFDPQTGTTPTFASIAHIGASNGFAGDFRWEDPGSLSTSKGTLTGRFYGPAAQEIGAAFATARTGGRIAVGTIMGRLGASDVGNASFNNDASGPLLANSQSFAAVTARENYTLTGRSGDNGTSGAFTATSAQLESTAIRYDAATGTYTLAAPDTGSTITVGRTLNVSPTEQQNLAITNTALTSNVPTSYVRIGDWSRAAATSGSTSYRDAFMAFGMPTADSEIVRAGSAGFRIAVRGRAADDNYPNITNFDGKGDLFVDFAGGTLNAVASLNFVEDYFIAGRQTGRARGDLRFTSALGSSNIFSGSATMDGIGNYSGNAQGRFFGPNAAEVGGVFSLTDGGGGAASGAFVGLRDAAVTDPAASVPRLSDLTSATDLGLVATATSLAVGDLVGVTYNPDTQGYRVSFQDTHLSGAPVRTVTFDATTEDVATTDASYRGYAAIIDGTRPVTASLLRPDNSLVALSYISLGEFVIQRTTNPFQWARFYAVYGVPTPHMPSTGTASYDGIVRGFASVTTSSTVGDGAATLYALAGTSGMSVNFADQRFTATLGSLVGTPTFNGDGSSVDGMPTRAFDPLNFSGDLTGATFRGGFNGHSISGRFFGPEAAEFGAVFSHADGTPNVSPVAIDLNGVAAGRKR